MTLRILASAFTLTLMLGTPVVAQTTIPQNSDCVAEVRTQRQAAEVAGTPMTRSQAKAALVACQNAELKAYIADQERLIEALRAQIAELDLRIDENRQILDANNQIIGLITEINGQLTIQRELRADIERIEANTERMLAEAERILMRLATQ